MKIKTSTEILERIKKSGFSIPLIEKSTEVKASNLYKWLKGTNKPDLEQLLKVDKWLDEIDLNPKSEKPKPDMLQENQLNYLKERLSKKNGDKAEFPVYYGNTRAGIIQVYSDEPEMQEPVASLPARLFPGCNHAEKVTGDSMYPLIINQGLVIGKIIDKKGFMWGEKYGIHTKYGQSVIKYLHPSDKQNHVKLVSHNKTVPAQDIPIDDITFCFRVYYIVNPS